MDAETETAETIEEDEILETLHDVAAFLDDPIALLERALVLVRRRGEDA